MGKGRVGVDGSRQSLVTAAAVPLTEIAKAHVESAGFYDPRRKWDDGRGQDMTESLSDEGKAI
jgi:hypothetical protein